MKEFLIWSNEHSSWWKANHRGYTLNRDEAGRYQLSDAINYCGKDIDEMVPDEVMVPSPEMIVELTKESPNAI